MSTMTIDNSINQGHNVSNEYIKSLFRKYDKDHNGYLSTSDVQQMIKFESKKQQLFQGLPNRVRRIAFTFSQKDSYMERLSLKEFEKFCTNYLPLCKALHIVFKDVDEDGSGKIDFKQFCQGLENMGLENNKKHHTSKNGQTTYDIFKSIDIGFKGRIEFDQWATYFKDDNVSQLLKRIAGKKKEKKDKEDKELMSSVEEREETDNVMQEMDNVMQEMDNVMQDMEEIAKEMEKEIEKVIQGMEKVVEEEETMERLEKTMDMVDEKLIGKLMEGEIRTMTMEEEKEEEVDKIEALEVQMTDTVIGDINDSSITSSYGQKSRLIFLLQQAAFDQYTSFPIKRIDSSNVRIEI